jgi:hypothetical protein
MMTQFYNYLSVVTHNVKKYNLFCMFFYETIDCILLFIPLTMLYSNVVVRVRPLSKGTSKCVQAVLILRAEFAIGEKYPIFLLLAK